jgi:thermitase
MSTTDTPVERSQDEDRYYYADGERIPLRPSTHFMALRASGDADLAFSEVSAIAASPTAQTPPGAVLVLPEQDLIVVEVCEEPLGPVPGIASAAPQPEAVEALVATSGELELGPPVYETTEAGNVDSLVPTGEIIVKFGERTPADAVDALLRAHRVEVRQSDYPEPGAYLVATVDGDSIDIANALHEHELVDYAEPNFTHIVPRLAAETATRTDAGDVVVADDLEVVPAAPEGPTATVSDPAFPQQWGLVTIRAPQAWDVTMGSAGITIAIIDEGCDLSHEDLVYKLPGYDAWDGDDNPTPNGNDAHGTACAGVAAARANNGRGGAGVAPGCRTLPIRIAKGVGGGFWDTTSAKVADGIRKAVDRGADVLSNSYGVAPSSVVTSAFQYARTNGRGGRGCVIAAATGNGDVRGVIYPARLSPTIPGFLAVGASNQWDQRKSKTSLDGEHWWGSNFGPEVDLVAPGVKIYTTDIMGSAGYAAGNYAPTFNGTSSATPHVAGVAALVLSVDPDLRSWEVEDILKMTADDLGAAGRDEQFGFGRLNAHRAVLAARRLAVDVQVTPVFLGSGRECFMRLNVRVHNPGINSVRLNSLVLRSHTADGTSEVDRMELVAQPGGVMAPRSGDVQRLSRVLLRANGTQASWSYRWSASWTYTFWRPTSPALPLHAGSTLADSDARTVVAEPIWGSRQGGRRAAGVAPVDGVAPAEAADGGTLTVDRGVRSITITFG